MLHESLEEAMSGKTFRNATRLWRQTFSNACLMLLCTLTPLIVLSPLLSTSRPRCWSLSPASRVAPVPRCHLWTLKPWRKVCELHTAMMSPPRMWCRQPCTPRCSRNSKSSLVSVLPFGALGTLISRQFSLEVNFPPYETRFEHVGVGGAWSLTQTASLDPEGGQHTEPSDHLSLM